MKGKPATAARQVLTEQRQVTECHGDRSLGVPRVTGRMILSRTGTKTRTRIKLLGLKTTESETGNPLDGINARFDITHTLENSGLRHGTRSTQREHRCENVGESENE